MIIPVDVASVIIHVHQAVVIFLSFLKQKETDFLIIPCGAASRRLRVLRVYGHYRQKECQIQSSLLSYPAPTKIETD